MTQNRNRFAKLLTVHNTSISNQEKVIADEVVTAPPITPTVRDIYHLDNVVPEAPNHGFAKVLKMQIPTPRCWEISLPSSLIKS